MESMDAISITERENSAHLGFFGRIFNLDAFRCFLGQVDPETLCEWLRLGLGPHFFPRVEMANGEDYAKFPGWKITPGEWFLQAATDGSFFYPTPAGEAVLASDALNLGGRIVLIDTRARPRLSQSPDQVFERDNLLGPIILTLRRKGSLVLHPGHRVFSRFGISPKEWRQVASALADRLEVEDEQVRLERVVEANVITQLYPGTPRGKDFRADSYIMVEECLAEGTKQLSTGGDSGVAGPYFAPLSQEDHWFSCAVRPLIVLDEV